MLPLVGGLVAGKFVHDMMEADKNTERAERTILKATARQFESENTEKEVQSQFNASISKLANRKRAILKSSFPKFKEIYGQIMKINFHDDTRGIKELFQLAQTKEYQTSVSMDFSIEPIKLTDRQLVASFVTPGAKTFLLGGGLVGGIVLGASGSIVKDSELSVKMANIQKKQARLYTEAVEAKKDAISAVCWHLDQVSDVLAKLNALFLKSMKSTAVIIEKNGYDGQNYSDQELEYIGTCLNLAKAVKAIIDAPVLDENNRVVDAAKQTIITGQTFIEEFKALV